MKSIQQIEAESHARAAAAGLLPFTYRFRSASGALQGTWHVLEKDMAAARARADGLLAGKPGQTVEVTPGH